MRDADGLEELRAGGVVVAAEEEELLEDLGRERRVLLPRPRWRRCRWAVPADAAHLPLLVLVVVPADPARVLSLTLPHLSPPPPPIESKGDCQTPSIESGALTHGGVNGRKIDRGGSFSFFLNRKGEGEIFLMEAETDRIGWGGRPRGRRWSDGTRKT